MPAVEDLGSAEDASWTDLVYPFAEIMATLLVQISVIQKYATLSKKEHRLDQHHKSSELAYSA